MRTLFNTAIVALFIGQNSINAIKINQRTRFVDDVMKLLAEAEEKDLMEDKNLTNQTMGQCNPCYNSSLGPNPHYPFKGEKVVPVGGTVEKTTDYAGPVTSDANVPGFKGGEEKKAALAECNPCYTSNTGPNPYWDYPGNKDAAPFGSTRPPAEKKDEKKDAEKKEGLVQIECNPCPVSAMGKNPHYPYSGPPPKAAGGDEKKDDEKKESLAQCNPCYTSSTGPNTHWNYPGNAKAKPFGSTNPPVAKEDDKKEEKKEGLAQLDCNPCPNSSAGQNPHYPFKG